MLGTSTVQPRVEDSEDEEFTSYEHSIVEAVLKADGSGTLVRHPFLNNKLQQLLAKWAFKVATGGGFRMPAFALADDGYLFVHNGQVFAGSDWIPEDTAISSLSTARGLVIRYPIRMKEDLLPVEMLSFQATVERLEQILLQTAASSPQPRFPTWSSAKSVSTVRSCFIRGRLSGMAGISISTWLRFFRTLSSRALSKAVLT